jgi:hypothetical protein
VQRLNHYHTIANCKQIAMLNAAQERGIRGRKAGSHLSSTTPHVDTLPCLSRRDDATFSRLSIVHIQASTESQARVFPKNESHLIRSFEGLMLTHEELLR